MIMKKHVMFTTSIIIAMTTVSIAFTGCNNKPTVRPSVVNPEVAGSVFAIKDLSEITNASAKLVYFSGGEKTVDPTLKQVKLEGKAQELVNKVTNPVTKKMIDDHLKTGVIAIVVLDDQVKILKIVPETHSTFEMTLTSLSYLSKLKTLVKTSSAQTQASLVSELESIKDKSPAQLGETFGLAEVTAIKIEKFGHLDNEKTDYQEKKSLLNVVAGPFEASTHILVGKEIGTESAAASDATTKISK